MKQQLIQYVNLLFAGANNCEDIKQEILQNTIDRYDDLIAEGKTPEAAYRLAIIGIGDINEILGSVPQHSAPQNYTPASSAAAPVDSDTPVKKTIRSIGVALYILCPVPLFLLSEMGMSTVGLCGTIAMVAVATALMILGKKNDSESEKRHTTPDSPKDALRKSIGSIIWAVGLAVYFIVSFATGAWFVTWVIFPLIAAIQGLVNALMDLKEEK